MKTLEQLIADLSPQQRSQVLNYVLQIYRRDEIVNVYKGGATLRQCAKRFGITYQRVQQIIAVTAPEIIRQTGRPSRHDR
jgi:hypothetical protein